MKMKVYLNGSFLPAEQAGISPFDRAFLFGDGVYEAMRVFDNVIVSGAAHVARLRASMNAAGITGFNPGDIIPLSRQLLRENNLTNASLYWQVSRGVSMPRRHLPDADITPTVFATATPALSLGEITGPSSLSVVLLPDERRLRCDIKATSLLPVILAKLAADRAGADEALLYREPCLHADEPLSHADLMRRSRVTEAGSCNVFFVFNREKGCEIVTPPVNGTLLQGITRNLVMHLVPEIVERHVYCSEIWDAAEVILTGTTTLVAAVVKINDQLVGNGEAGPVANRLFAKLIDAIRHDVHKEVTYRNE